jgi:phosphoadenosine phosphosulfate reductase
MFDEAKRTGVSPMAPALPNPSETLIVAAQDRGRTSLTLAGGSDLVRRHAAALNVLLLNAAPEDIIAAAQETVSPDRLAAVSSFGAESAVLLAAIAAVAPALPVLLIDTGYLFPETLAYRDELQQRLGLRDVRVIRPDPAEVKAEDGEGDLYSRAPDACCALRKVRPLARALDGFDGWINGRKRFQSDSRASISLVEADGARLKFNPLAGLSREDIAARFEQAALPPHPLEKFGFRSIGCMPCTSRSLAGEDPRAGRWRGRGKVECGIHTSLSAVR